MGAVCHKKETLLRHVVWGTGACSRQIMQQELILVAACCILLIPNCSSQCMNVEHWKFPLHSRSSVAHSKCKGVVCCQHTVVNFGRIFYSPDWYSTWAVYCIYPSIRLAMYSVIYHTCFQPDSGTGHTDKSMASCKQYRQACRFTAVSYCAFHDWGKLKG